jgi:hypothetical protein
MLVCRIKPPARCPGNLLLEGNHVSTDRRLFLQVRCFALAGYSVPGRSGRTTLSCAR